MGEEEPSKGATHPMPFAVALFASSLLFRWFSSGPFSGQLGLHCPWKLHWPHKGPHNSKHAPLCSHGAEGECITDGSGGESAQFSSCRSLASFGLCPKHRWPVVQSGMAMLVLLLCGGRSLGAEYLAWKKPKKEKSEIQNPKNEKEGFWDPCLGSPEMWQETSQESTFATQNFFQEIGL